MYLDDLVSRIDSPVLNELSTSWTTCITSTNLNSPGSSLAPKGSSYSIKLRCDFLVNH